MNADQRDVSVRISGVGHSTEVTVKEGSTLEDALAEAGVDLNAAGLQAKVNGEVANPADTTVNDGDQVITTPRNTKLG